MKNNISLIAFLFLLCGQTAYSQKTLPSGVRPYAENWPASLVDAMDRAGFEIGAVKAVPQPAPIQQRNMLRLDSTKTFFAYNPATGDSTPVSQTRYLYPSVDSKMEITFQYENDTWVPLSRSLYVSDDQQRLVEIIAEEFDAETQDFKFNSRLEIFPHGNSDIQVDSFLTFVFDAEVQEWQVLMANRNAFDAQDRMQESATTLYYLGAPVIFLERYAYDANGDNHLIEEFGIFDGQEMPTGKTEMTYVDHQVIEAVVYASDGVGYLPQDRTNYAYTLFGALRKEMHFQWDVATSNFRLNQTVDFFYDSQQRLAGRETVLIQPGQWDIKERMSYAYVEGLNLYLEYKHFWNDDLFDWILDSKKYYYYDSATAVDPDPMAGQALEVWPNPAVTTVQLNLVAETSVQIFDKTGRMLQSRMLQPGQSLDVSALPSGVYVLSAQQGKDRLSRQIVKQ